MSHGWVPWVCSSSDLWKGPRKKSKWEASEWRLSNSYVLMVCLPEEQVASPCYVHFYHRVCVCVCLCVCSTPQAAIRKELNEFKSREMEVHEDSKQFTRYSDGQWRPPFSSIVTIISASLVIYRWRSCCLLACIDQYLPYIILVPP